MYSSTVNRTRVIKPVILSVEDDEGHALLIRQNLEESGLGNRIEHFGDGQAILDFFYPSGNGRIYEPGQSYIVLLDIRMPNVDGIEVLRRIKADPRLHALSVIMLTTSEDATEVERCHRIGCSAYLRKPVDYETFSSTVRQLGHFISLLLVPPTAEMPAS